MRDVLAPGGWGWRPGTLLTPPTAEHLPELPLLRVVGNRQRTVVICQALRSLSFIHQVKARHLQDRYGLNHQTAHDVLRKAKALA